MSLKGDVVEATVVTPPDTEALDMATSKVIEVIEALLFTPSDEVAEARAMGVEGCLRYPAASFVEVELYGGFRVDEFEFVHGLTGNTGEARPPMAD